MAELHKVNPEEVNREQQRIVRELIGDEAYEALKKDRWVVRRRQDVTNTIALIGLGSIDWKEGLEVLDLTP